MWHWTTKEEKAVKPKVLKIPVENVREILVLLDTYNNASGSSHTECYDLWHRIHELFPEVAGKTWQITIPTARSVEIIEVLKE